MLSNLLPRLQQRDFDTRCRRLALAVVLAAAVTGLYGIATGHTGGDGELRATGPLGEAYNIFAGYLNQGVAVAVALALASRSGRWRLLLGAAALALVVSVLYTHSREGYVRLAAVLGVLGSRGFRVLLLVGIVLVFLGPVLPRQFRRGSRHGYQVQNSGGQSGRQLAHRTLLRLALPLEWVVCAPPDPGEWGGQHPVLRGQPVPAGAGRGGRGWIRAFPVAVGVGWLGAGADEP